MNLTVTLEHSPVAKVPMEGALVLPDSIDITFASDYALPELLIVSKNGDKTEKAKVTDGHYTVPASLLFAGCVEVSVSLILRGEVVKRWSLEPILVKEIDGDFTAYAGFEEMRSQIAELFRRTEIII